MNFAFELQKLKREIQTHGKQYRYYRDDIDEDGEPTGEEQIVAESCGLFHIEKSYITRTKSDGTNTRVKGNPKILVLWEETNGLKCGDKIKINDKTYVITDINNIQEYNIVCDLSLEVILNGNN
jgi:hypothetical protein